MSDWVGSNYFWIIDDDHNVRRANSMEEWFSSYEEHHRMVAQTGNKNIWISTIFLGLNHNFFDEGPPILFETMVFGGHLHGSQWRYNTYDEALKGHHEVVALAFIHVSGVGD